MALTAREWILLPKEEMEARKGELSSEECLKLRIELDMVHFTEEEKQRMSPEEKERFIHPPRMSEEERAKVRKQGEIFIEETKKKLEAERNKRKLEAERTGTGL